MAGEPSTPTLPSLQSGEYEDLWRQLLRARPNDVSGILSLRLLAAEMSEGERPGFLATLRQTYSGTLVERAIDLEEISPAMAASDWERAADLLLRGLADWPFEWETPRRIESLRTTLADRLGERLQAEILSVPSKSNLNALRSLRDGLRLEREERKEQASAALSRLREELQAHPNDYHKNLSALLEPALSRLRVALGNPTPEDRIVQSVQEAPLDHLPALLVSAASLFTSTPTLPARFLWVARARIARDEIREALAVLEALQIQPRRESAVTAGAWRESLALLDRRWKAMQALTGEISGERFEGVLLEPLERPLRERARGELELCLERASGFIREASYSPEAEKLALSIREAYEGLGGSEKAQGLLLHLAESANREQRERLATSAERFSPEEAIAILQLRDTSQTERVGESLATSRELLALLEGKGDFAGAAKVAHALALEASGTEEYPEALFKAASLDFRSEDYPKAEETLSNLLKSQDPKSPEYARTANLLSKTKYNRGDYAEARRLFEQLSENPNLTQAERENLSLLRLQTLLYALDYQKTLEEIQRLRETRPSRDLARQLDLLEQRIRR
ncbi:MAG: hypothetical protein HUU16_12375 [Candidatus Omnitrophica bacterium]|nr:hypothetical protein [Candidatus Omnitrophota bacterium]